MFHSDQPISKKELDCLNRAEFSKQLAKAILSYTKNDNFAISLCGKWGSGKTSILNMVTEEIGELTKDIEEDQKPVIIKFNPWNYSDCSQLIKQFFITLQTQMKMFDKNGALDTIGTALQKYSSVLDYSEYIPVVGQYLKLAKGLLSGLGEQLADKAEENNNIEIQKQIVIKALSEQKHKFIIIIDDIDRLNNAQIRAIFQLVNSLAGFPNMIYLLSFDREVVARALQEEQNCNGEEYLEKIIQVPFEVPEANKQLVENVFISMLENVVIEEEQLAKFDNRYWSEIFYNCILPFIDSIRDANRVINTFEFKHGLMKDEVNVIDLLALTTLQVCVPAIYRWIYSNFASLIGSVESAGGISGVEQNKNANQYLEMFEKIYPDNPRMMLKVIQSMFPKFAWNTGGYVYNSESNDELRYKDKIASSDRIMRYFRLSMEEIAISKKQVKDSIIFYTKEQLNDFFVHLLQNGKFVVYLQELLAFIPEIPPDRKTLFIKALVEVQTWDDIYNRKNKLSPIPSAKCYSVLYEILKQGEFENNKVTLNELICNSNVKQVSSLCRIIEELEKAYGRRGDYVNSSYQFVSEQDLDELETNLLDKLKTLAKTENFLDSNEKESVYRTWRYLEKETLDAYIVKMLQQPVNVPKYLSLRVGSWSSGKTNGWHFESEAFSEHIDKEEAYQKILSLKNTEDFSTLRHELKEIAISFYLWFGEENVDRHDINKEKVNAIIPMWEKK